jgi:RNA polymerase sigma-70 factor (ECF subfamily)
MYGHGYAAMLAAPPEHEAGGPEARLPELVGLDDATLAVRLRDGDAEAFSALYRAYYARLVAIARIYTGVAVAEELVQEFLAGVWERRADWRVGDGIGVYLYAAIRNRARNYVRHEGVVGRVEQSSVMAGESPGLGNASESPHARLEREDIRAAIESALARLPEGMRTAFELRWMHELSYPEVARIMGIAEPAARKQVSKARAVIFPVLEGLVRE